MTTTVNAPADAVWRLFVDVERWPELTKSMREVRRVDSGPLRVGSEAIVRQPRLRPTRWRVTELDPGKAFTWRTTTAGMTMDAVHVVEATGERTGRITLTLRLTGPLAGLVGAVTHRMAARNLALELAGFRRTAESAQN